MGTERWSTSRGFLLAAIGSAVGIGNIWRFSAVLGQNGGGAYLIPYLIAVFLFALPLMILEITMGRHFRGTVVSAFGEVRPQFRIIGWLLVAIIFLISSYYLVITGWTMGYTWFALTGQTVTFAGFTGSYLPVLLFLAATVVTGLVVSRGIRGGIERISLVLIPVCMGILCILALYGIFLPGFGEGVRYLFTPDFSVLADPLIWSAAFGQAFFSLSVGEGILLTYGTYLPKEQDIPRSSWIITLADLSVALLAGLVIFPVVFTYGLAPGAGAELAFSSLPLAFARMPAGGLFGLAFFLVLFFAALTSAVSMLEVGVAALRESLGWTRARTAALLTGLVILAGLPSALSYSAANLSLGSVRVLDFLDETVGTIGLPIGALLTSLVFGWFVADRVFSEEYGESRRMVRWVIPLSKYVIPAVLIVTTLARIAAGFDFPGTRFNSGSPFIGSLLQVEGIAVILLLLLAAILLFCRIRRCRG